jgi:lipopolysaccharide/colanic/teichoic acid biosynthesis glycosyltransferase
MLKRAFDFVVATVLLVLLSPILLPTMFLVWWQDRHSPFYIAPRTGRDGVPFRMVKLRSMVINADKSGVDSTASNDRRITKVGQFIRRTKLDEIAQLWNVLLGDMSLVGPRPNVKRETDLYTPQERHLLSVRPGMTDFASIVFADEGDILKDQADPDIAYNQLIRPGKGYLGLFYIEKRSFLVDLQVGFLTVMAAISRQSSLEGLQALLSRLGAPPELLRIASRREPLVPTPPPGANRIVTSRDGSL